MTTRTKKSKRNIIEGKAEVCCHCISWWYDLDNLKLTDEIQERLAEEAEERAQHDLIEGCPTGGLNCLYHGDDAPGGVEICGGWQIERD